jgi:hypothetical protein
LFSVLHWFVSSDYSFGIFKYKICLTGFAHCAIVVKQLCWNRTNWKRQNLFNSNVLSIICKNQFPTKTSSGFIWTVTVSPERHFSLVLWVISSNDFNLTVY